MKKLALLVILAGLVAPFSGLEAANNPENLPAPTVFFAASPEVVPHGEFSILSWSSLNATSCSASGGWRGRKNIAGNENIRPDKTEKYRLHCRGPGGSTSKEIEITLKVKRGKPSLIFMATPRAVEFGRSTKLEWDSPNADSCVASGGTGRGWSGTKSSKGSLTIRPVDTARYDLTCSNEFGMTIERLTVVVNTPPPLARVFGELAASCSASPTAALPGEPVNFLANASGGNPPYIYQWSGAFTAIGITKTLSFDDLGTQSATLTVTDGTDETVTTSCSALVTLSPPLVLRADETGGSPSKITNSRDSRAPVTRFRESSTQKNEGGKNPVLAAFQRDLKSPLASVGSVFVGLGKLLGWLLLFAFNLLLLIILGLILFQIRKEYLAGRQINLNQLDLDEAIAWSRNGL